jgi:hypothetical protein
MSFHRLAAGGEWLHVFPEGGVWQTPVLGGRLDAEKARVVGKLKWGIGKLIAHSEHAPIVVPLCIMGSEHMVPQHPVTKVPLTPVPIPGHKVTVQFGAEISFADLIEEHEREFGPIRRLRSSDLCSSDLCSSDLCSSDLCSSDLCSSEVYEPPATKGRTAQPGAHSDALGDLGSADGGLVATRAQQQQQQQQQQLGARSFHVIWDSSPTDLLLYQKITRRIEVVLEDMQQQQQQQ